MTSMSWRPRRSAVAAFRMADAVIHHVERHSVHGNNPNRSRMFSGMVTALGRQFISLTPEVRVRIVLPAGQG